jgi:hypothetical protein
MFFFGCKSMRLNGFNNDRTIEHATIFFLKANQKCSKVGFVQFSTKPVGFLTKASTLNRWLNSKTTLNSKQSTQLINSLEGPPSPHPDSALKCGVVAVKTS